MAITIAATADSLNQHHVVYKNEIVQALRQGLEFESRFNAVPCEYMYSPPNISVTDLVQPYQHAFTPNNNETFDAVESILQPIKIDIQYTAEELEKFYDKWAVNWFELGDGKNPLEWTFPRYMWNEVILPKVIEEMNSNSWSGVYAAPTPGTAGNSVDSVDGYAKKIADAITAGDLTPVNTGAFVATTMVDQIEAWCDALPVPYRDAAGDIYMSKTNAKLYWRDYRANFGTGAGVGNNQNPDLRVDMTNKRVVGIAAMEGSDRIFFSPEVTRNHIYGVKRGQSLLPMIRWEPFERTLKGMAEFYRFYSFEYWGHLFVNDQT